MSEALHWFRRVLDAVSVRCGDLAVGSAGHATLSGVAALCVRTGDRG